MEIHLVGYGPPKQHDVFRQWLITRKYPFKGFRKGYNSPFVIEGKYYIVKLKKECMDDFLSELKGSTEEMSGSGRSIPNLVNRIIGFISRITGLIYPKGKNRFNRIDMKKVKEGDDTMFEWFKTQILFTQNDVVKDGKEEL